MKILDKKESTSEISKDIIYTLDSLKSESEIKKMLDILMSDGHCITRYTIHQDYDHSNLQDDPHFYSYDEFLKELNSIAIEDIRTIDFISNNNGTEIIGTIKPENGILRLSALQKKNEVEVDISKAM